jgi:hypothetical protein
MNEQPRESDFPGLEEQNEDIAVEHDDLTVGDQKRGGPGGTAEDESPEGYGGADLPGHPRNC